MKKILLLSLSTVLLLLFSITAFADFDNTHENTGDGRKDIISIAATQTGYTADGNESKYDYITSNDTDSWSTSFIVWCASQAQISDKAVPHTDDINALYDYYYETEYFHTPQDYIPEAGDMIFIKENDTLMLAGFVTAVDDEYVTAIIGDSDNSVKKKMYGIDLTKIHAYVSPDYTIKAVTVTGNHVTTATALNFRQEPTTASEIISKIPLGTVVNIEKIENGWGYLKYEGSYGWVSMDYAEPYDNSHTNTSVYGVKWNVIDISKFQGDIDWDRVADANLDAVIIRIGFRGTKTKVIHPDDRFLEYYQGAKEIGLHVGCYFYSGATTVQEAREEAYFIIDYIRDNNLEFDMPVYWDVEDKIIKETGRENICSMTEVFFETMDAEKIYSGVYTSTSWMEDFFSPALFERHALWIADWRGSCGYTGEYGMWQYTETGSISGIDANYTDLNICYIDYPRLIADYEFNTSLPPVTEPPEGPSGILAGDVNGNGTITAADARLALRAAANLTALTPLEAKAADINGDGKTTAADARLILRIAANLD